jgi:cytoskeletal protein RodZ
MMLPGGGISGMGSDMTVDDAVSSSKRGVLVALSLVAVVAALLGAGYFFFGGADLVADLTGDKTVAETPSTPAPEAAPTTTDAGASESTSTASTEATEATEPAEDTEAAPSGFTNTDTNSNTAATPPTGDQAARMYWEQVASQEQIGKLVAGEISSVSFGTVTKSGNTANVRLTVTGKSGSVSGTMVLRNYSGVWYFSSIARDGSSLAVTTGKAADLGIVSTLIANQASNQSIVNGIISGGYKTCTVNGVSSGSGTATIKMTVGGGSSPSTAGSIVCVSKTIGGTKNWFITSFTKN